MVIGIASSKKLNLVFTRYLITGYVIIVRGIPLYIHVLIAYFVLPDLIGINLSSFSAGIFALSLCFTAYITEVIRAGTNAVPDGQWDAAYVLGYNQLSTLWYIIIPQMLRNIFPALVNLLEELIKATAILSAIGTLELTRVSMNIIARHMNPGTIYIIAAIMYLIVSILLNIVAKYIERRLAYDHG